MKNDPIIYVVLGDGITQNYNVKNPNANTFKGPNAPQEAKRFLEEKFPENKPKPRRKYRRYQEYAIPDKRTPAAAAGES
jgi:hypothetical protein